MTSLGGITQVAPWVVDVTAALKGVGREQGRPHGTHLGASYRALRSQPLRVQYQGLYQGADPPQGVSGAYVMMESSLVLLP